MSDVTLVVDDKKNGIFNMQPWTKLKKNLTYKQKVVAAPALSISRMTYVAIASFIYTPEGILLDLGVGGTHIRSTSRADSVVRKAYGWIHRLGWVGDRVS
jgi:hypothetical protein